MTGPERGMHLDPGSPVKARCGWRGFALDDGTGGGGCVREAGHAGGHGFADGSGYEPKPARQAKGDPEPIVLERVETAVAGRPIATPVLNAAWKVEISDRHGTVILDCGCTRQGYAPGEVRRFAAVLASYADAAEADLDPDPAEVEALAVRILAVKDRYADADAQRIARAVLAAGYERRQTVDEGPGWMGSPVERRRP